MTHEQAAKNRLHKILRRESRILIDEALVPDPVVIECNEEAFLDIEWNATPSTAYRLVVCTQVRENYGAHSWNGYGEVPQRWKCKGGNEYHLDNMVSQPCSKLLKERLESWRSRIERSNSFFQEYVISAEWVGNNELTHEEWLKMDRDSWGWDDTSDARIFLSKEREMEAAWDMYHEFHSVEAHNNVA